jgi:hypothetical protein
MGHVFISYARKDAKFVDALRQQLKTAGFEVWTDSILRPGNDWRHEIDEAIRNAFALIVIITPWAKSSEYVTYEWAFALGLGIKVIPVVVRPTSLHPRLEYLQHVDFILRRGEDFPWERLIEGLMHIKESAGTVTVSEVSMPSIPELRTARMNAPGAWVIVKRGPQLEQLWNLNKDIVSVGREITNDIVINDQQVSRRHARFIRNAQGPFARFAIEDLSSSNGTFINEQRMTGMHVLDDGDVIEFGETITLVYKVITEG